MSFSKITIVGSGNVAYHLAKQMQKQQLPLVEVVARPSPALSEISKKCKVAIQDDFQKMKAHAGLYLLAVSDKSIAKVAKGFPAKVLQKGHLVHTSGATASSVLKKATLRHGAFWPLQTFSKSRKVNFKGLPFLITAASPALQKNLAQLAADLGGISQFASDSDRLRYHCAAVIVNNFTNHLFTEAESFLAKKDLPFDVLHPLMLETVKKAMEIGPREAQTGPAKRGDQETMDRHLDLLQGDEGLAEIYLIISQFIANKENEN